MSIAFVRFRVPGDSGMYRAPFTVKHGDSVLAETEHGLRMGTVLAATNTAVVAHAEGEATRAITRVATADDHAQAASNVIREREAFTFCARAIERHQLAIKLVAVEITHAGTRAIFYFSSDDRVDFRGLVKDLARHLQTRIEMRQIGVRDAARHTGGIGSCGRELCCATCLREFQPITIRMAKDQNLSVAHDKLSGVCGRLRCCLHYEQCTYERQRRELPKLGKRVVTPKGDGRVKDVNVLTNLIRVQLDAGGYVEVPAAEIRRPADVAEQMERAREVAAEREAIIAAGGTPIKRRRRRKKQPV